MPPNFLRDFTNLSASLNVLKATFGEPFGDRVEGEVHVEYAGDVGVYKVGGKAV